MPDLDRMEEALHRIVQWAEAYPLDSFREPDWKAALGPYFAAKAEMDAQSSMRANLRFGVSRRRAPARADRARNRRYFSLEFVELGLEEIVRDD
jgi:hypothetical protein